MSPSVTQGLVIAFDFGLKWIGVATGQQLTASSSPLTTLAARNGKVERDELLRLVGEWRPERLLVGLPLNMDDSESDMCERARQFARLLEQWTELPVELVDERLSTREAVNRRGAARTGKPGDKSHAAAACVIAETWLNENS